MPTGELMQILIWSVAWAVAVCLLLGNAGQPRYIKPVGWFGLVCALAIALLAVIIFGQRFVHG